MQTFDNKTSFWNKTHLYFCSKKSDLKLVENNFTKDIQATTKLTSSHELLKIISKINISLYGFVCVNHTQTQKRLNYKNRFVDICIRNNSFHNASCLLTNNLYLLNPKAAQFSEYDHLDHVITEWIPFLILGLLCIFGNGFVIIRKMRDLVRKLNQNKENQIYNRLVLSLSCADLLMGIYLVAISFEIKRKSNAKNIYYGEYKFCNALGILNFVSSQVSLSTITLISYFRLCSVVYPYKKVSQRFALFLIIMTWILWILIAVLPVVDTEPLRNIFRSGIRDSELPFFDSGLYFYDYEYLFDAINRQIKNDTFLKYIFNGISEYSSSTVVEQAMKSFNLIDYQNISWIPINVYSEGFYCTVNLLIDYSYRRSTTVLLFIIIFNLTLCVLVIIAYVLLYSIIANWQSKLTCFTLKNKAKDKNERYQSDRKHDENYKISLPLQSLCLPMLYFGLECVWCC